MLAPRGPAVLVCAPGSVCVLTPCARNPPPLLTVGGGARAGDGAAGGGVLPRQLAGQGHRAAHRGAAGGGRLGGSTPGVHRPPGAQEADAVGRQRSCLSSRLTALHCHRRRMPRRWRTVRRPCRRWRGRCDSRAERDDRGTGVLTHSYALQLFVRDGNKGTWCRPEESNGCVPEQWLHTTKHAQCSRRRMSPRSPQGGGCAS